MSAVGTSAWRRETWGASCDRDMLTTDYWIIGAGKITCHKLALSAFRALGRVLRAHRYHVRSDVTGCYNCRQITGGTVPSAHAYAIALDVNWDTNPYRTDRLVTDMDAAMIADVLHIKTDAGVQVFRWGGDWDARPETPERNYDAMHFEIIATPEQLAAGFSVRAPDAGDRWSWPLLALDERGAAVRMLQSTLRGLIVDGTFGPRTRAGVIEYQRARGLVADGVVGLGTWTALFTAQPQLAARDSLPDKGQSITPSGAQRVS